MHEKRVITDEEIQQLQDAGYQVEDLNDNPHGLTVRGPSWKVTLDDETVGYEWIAQDGWTKARKHAKYGI